MDILGLGHCPGGPELSGTFGTSRTSRTGTGTTLGSRACLDFVSDCVRWFVLSASKVVSFVPDVPGGSRAVVRDVRGSSRFVVRDVPGGCRLVVRDVPSCCRGFDTVIGQFLIFTSCISIYRARHYHFYDNASLCLAPLRCVSRLRNPTVFACTPFLSGRGGSPLTRKEKISS